MTQRVKSPVAKLDDLSLSLGPTRWKERKHAHTMTRISVIFLIFKKNLELEENSKAATTSISIPPSEQRIDIHSSLRRQPRAPMVSSILLPRAMNYDYGHGKLF